MNSSSSTSSSEPGFEKLLSPLEQERYEFGYDIEDIRGKPLRIIKRPKSNGESTCCVFFVHGGGGRGCQFKHQIAATQEIADVVAFDFLGHGDSPSPYQPNLYTEKEHLQDLHEIFMRYRKESNFIVAHCYGAIHTLRLMKILRDDGLISCVKGLILSSIGPIAPISPLIPLFIPDGIMTFFKQVGVTVSNLSTYSPLAGRDLIVHENAMAMNNEVFVMKVLGKDCNKQAQWMGWIEEGREGIGEDIPVCIICGERDGMFRVGQCKRLCQVLGVPQERFQPILKAGHFCMLETPEEVNRIIHDFVLNFSSETACS